MTTHSDSLPAMLASRRHSPRRRARRLAFLMMIALAASGWFGGRHLWGRHYQAAGDRAVRQFDFPAAASAYERALCAHPEDRQLRLKAARTARRGGEFDRSRQHVSAYFAAHGVTRELQFEWALWHAQQGDLAAVEGPLHEALRHDHPDSTLILEALAQGYIQVYRLEAAVSAIHMLLDRVPEHAPALLWRGGVLEGSGRSDEAVDDFRRAVELRQADREYRLRLAEALLRMQRAAEAEPHVEELLRQAPADPRVRLAAARCCHALARPDDSRTHLDELLRQAPENVEAWAELGRIAYEETHYEEAVRCLERAAGLAPDSYAVGTALVTALRALSRTEEAEARSKELDKIYRDEKRLRDISLQLGRSPVNASLRYEAATICLQHHVQAEAVRWLRSALLDDPNFVAAKEALTGLRMDLDDDALRSP